MFYRKIFITASRFIQTPKYSLTVTRVRLLVHDNNTVHMTEVYIGSSFCVAFDEYPHVPNYA